MSKTAFTPVGTEVSNIIFTGYWVVRMDINEGEFIMRCADGEYGTVSIFEGSEKIIEEALDIAGVGVGFTSVDITLKTNQIILVQGMNEVVID